jgi:hypothetical protein
MNLITFFNYPDEKIYFNMFKIWLMQVIKCKQQTQKLKDIIIITEKLSDGIVLFLKTINLSYVKIIYGSYYEHVDNTKPKKWVHNVYFKFYNLCLQTEPYIFLDADAFIMKDLNEAIEISNAKPFICVNHQTIKGHTEQYPFKFLNTGFTIVSDPTFFNFEIILNTPIKYSCPGTDQMMVYNYCKTINYDYTHPNIHWGYNSCSAFKKILDNGKIISDGIPEKHEIYVLHYWYHYKPWTQCNCCVRGNETCDIYKKWSYEVISFFLNLN